MLPVIKCIEKTNKSIIYLNVKGLWDIFVHFLKNLEFVSCFFFCFVFQVNFILE